MPYNREKRDSLDVVAASALDAAHKVIKSGIRGNPSS
jgi:hypothetical protein